MIMSSMKRSPPVSASDEHPAKRCKLLEDDVTNSDQNSSECNKKDTICYFEHLSLEVLCKLLSYLPLRDALKLDTMSRRLREAVSLHLKLLKTLELSEANILGPMPSGITDYNLECVVNRCPNLEVIQGLFTGSRRISRLKTDHELSVEGVVDILKSCEKLKAVELDNPFILEAVLHRMPQLRILGSFINHGGNFPISDDVFSLSKNPKVRYLHLTGVTIPELPRMDSIIYLYMRFVKFTNPNPFSTFMAPNLHTFVMSNCAGPANALKYVPLVTRLAASRALRRLELVRVPFLGGLFQHVLEDTWKFGGFSSVENITLGACKHATEVDLGYLILTCSQKLFQLVIQPSLSKDNMFQALSMAEAAFPRIETLHLGYVDPFPEPGRWTNAVLVEQGLSEVTEHPALVTDVGVQIAGKMFSNLRNLIAYNCPYLKDPMKWLVEDGTNFAHLRYLHLYRCHSIRLPRLTSFIGDLPSLESIYLQEMFKEPPKGCGHVGLSAGTALGVSAAFLASQEGQPAGNAHPQDESANQNAGQENPDLLEIDEAEIPVQGAVPPVGKVAFDVANAAGVACGHASNTVSLPSSSGVQRTDSPKNSGIDPKDELLVEEIDAMFEDQKERSENEDRPEFMNDGKYDGKGKTPISGRKFVKGRKMKEKVESESEAGCSSKQLCDDSDSKPETKQVKDIDESDLKTQSRQTNAGPGTSEVTSSGTDQNDLQSAENAETTAKSADSSAKNADSNAESGESTAKSADEEMAISSARDDDSPKRTIGTQTSKTSNSALDDSDQSDGEAGHQSCGACETGSSPSRPPLPVYRIGRAGQQLADIPLPPRVLPIFSSSLVSLTLYMVGVEELFIRDCPQLTTLHVTACRALKTIILGRCDELYRVTVAQCPVFQHQNMLAQLSGLDANKSRVVFLRPMYQYDQADLKKCLFGHFADYQGYLVVDHSTNPSLTIHNKPRFEETVKLLTMINKSVLKDWCYQPVNCVNQPTGNPYSRHLRAFSGDSEDGCTWEVMTDVPWLPTLASTVRTESSLHFTLGPAEFKRGLYSPKYHNHTSLPNAMKAIEHDVAEFIACRNVRLKPYVMSVYVNTCDTSGTATPDMYV